MFSYIASSINILISGCYYIYTIAATTTTTTTGPNNTP